MHTVFLLVYGAEDTCNLTASKKPGVPRITALVCRTCRYLGQWLLEDRGWCGALTRQHCRVDELFWEMR